MKRYYFVIALLSILILTAKTSFAQHFVPVYSSIYQPMNFVVTAGTLDGSNLIAGDEIGIFDVDGGSEICVGSAILTAPITAGTPLTVVASTDDPLTTTIKDGFTSGNSIIYRIWDNSAGIEIICITPTYTPGFSEVFTSLGTAVPALAGITSPTAAAGTDADVCENGNYTLSGSATGQSSVTWTTAGDGTFDNANILGATYTPGTNDISNGTVTLTLTAYATAPCTDHATDDIILTIQDLPTAAAGADAGICEGSTHTLSGSATNQQSISWSTAGDGSFDNTALPGATYTPGTTDISNGSVVLTLTAVATSPCATNATDPMTLSIQETPTATAGADASICSGSTYTMAGSATDYQSVSWTTAGDGSFDNASSLTAIYTPGSSDISNGSVVLTLTATALSPCAGNDADNMTLTIQDAPTAGAGSDADICEGSTYTLAGTASNQQSVSWTTAGDGTFDNANILGAIYTPGTSDISSGSVVLTLTATAVSPCAVDATDDMTLSIQDAPTAAAGADASICEGSTYTLAGTASNQASNTWTTAGDGTFNNASSLTAIYTPGTNDISNGSVVLTLTAVATSPCAVDATDDMTLSIQAAATAAAGADADICEGDTYTLAGSASSQASNTWTTAGDGTFNDATSLTAIYTPGTNDISNGSVVLTLTATALAPCTADATDDMTITIQAAPTAAAGSDGTICGGETYTMAGSATNQQSISWSTAGDGTFDDASSLTAVYTPGTNDIANGSVVITITSAAVSPCAVDATDDMTLTIQDGPSSDAGTDADICEGSTYTLAGVAGNNLSVLWSTAGDGTFNDATSLTAIYTPGTNDISNGSVVLTLTSVALAPCTADATDDMTLSIQETVIAAAGADADVCEGSTYTLAGTASNQASNGWTTAGDGTFDDATSLTAVYTPGTNDISNGSVVLTLTAVAVAPCTVDGTDDMTLSIQETPTAAAGADADICEGDTYTLSGSVSGQASNTWTTAGDGTFNNASSLTAIYTPGTNDIANGSVVLTLTSVAIAPCAVDATDDMTLNIQLAPTASAGADADVCEGSAYTLSGGAANQQSVLWTTAGDGTFDNANILGATYTPGTNDITNGSVVLTLSSTAVSPCAVDATDDMTLSIQETPTAAAGADADLCEGDTYTLAGSASSQASNTWTTAGDGTFSNASSLTAIYTPGTNDISNGSVVLTLTATALAPCATDATDDMTISIQAAPTSAAGADANICETDTYTLAGSASYNVSVSWSTAGDGTFNDATSLTAIYTPGTNDISNGSVVLTLTSAAISPCAVDATDDMTLGIYGQPTATAGSDAGICENTTYTLAGSVTNEQSVTWTTAGDGTFDDTSLPAATYTPGTNDISNGSVILTITATAVSPCGVDATDNMTLSIQELPTASAGTDASICEDGTYTLSGSANNQLAVAWTTAGDGTFDNSVLLAATYTPGTNDIANGSVVLTLTATSIAPCGTNVPDDMTLTIQTLPSADAGADDIVASGSAYTLAGGATGQVSVLWTTAGDGTFDDATLLAATYTPGTTDIDDGSVVLTLTSTATAPCSGTDIDDMTLFISMTQTMNLTQGYNIMSFYVQPADVDLLNMVNPLVTNTTLIKVIDESGDFIEFLPGPGWVNYIGDMANTEGYYIKVTANTSLDAHGTQVILPYNIPLSTGWNMMGYPVKTSQDALTALQPLITNATLIKVMNEAGDFIQFIPPYGWLNTIVNFLPGEGYYIKLVSDDNISINPPTKGSTPSQVVDVPKTQYFFASGSNPFSPMNIIVQNISADGFEIEDGDEIAVYDGDIEVGSAVIHQGYDGIQVINVGGDDPSSEIIDGFTSGNTITFKYWDQSYNTVYENIQVTNVFGDDKFTGLGTFMGELEISALGTPEHNQAGMAFLGQNYPNPFKHNTTINYGLYEGGDVKLSIFDVSGRKVQIIEDAYRNRGRYTVEFKNSALEPGIYYYQLEVISSGERYSETKKMIVR